MIKKIISVKNVGRFVNYAVHGAVDFRPLTIFYAENGRGKTTLSAILRSLQSGSGVYIEERRTLGASPAAEAEVTLLLEGGQTIFKNGNWTQHLPNLEIFDATFVQENIATPTMVQYEQKKSLYRFVVGQKGVKLTEKVAELDVTIRQKNGEIYAKGTQIQGLGIGSLDVDGFLGLAALENIDKIIEDKNREVSSLKRADDIAGKAAPIQITVPPLPAVTNLLGKQLQDVMADVGGRIREHVATHTHQATEAWLRDGVGYMTDNVCPFCGQAIAGLELIHTYQAFFGKAYSDLKREISDAINSVDSLFDQRKIVALQGVIDANALLAQFWAEHLSDPCPSMEFAQVGKPWNIAREALREHLIRKSAAPLEPIATGPVLEEAIDAYEEMSRRVAGYNKAVVEFAEKVEQKKKLVAAGDLAQAQLDVKYLELRKHRHEPDPARLCTEYGTLVSTKAKLDEDKKAFKEDLDDYELDIFAKYEKGINYYLAKFSAGFRICNTNTNYMGGQKNSTWQVCINNVPVEVDDANGAAKPSLRNTLSSGDTSSLAFAFFMAKLDQDPDLDKKIVVFDDPVSSLDGHRKYSTMQLILMVCGRAKQVIVLSHDLHFLRLLWEEADKAKLNAIEVTGAGAESTIRPWDVEAATQSDYHKNLLMLIEYLDDPSKMGQRDVARCLRPLVEENLRSRFPREFRNKKMLGDCIKLIQNAGQNDALAILKPRCNDLLELNNYGRRYHHGENPGWSKEPVTDGELTPFVEKALEFVRK